MKVVSTRAELRTERAKIEGTVGLVPTMGALHTGHLTLIRAARADTSTVVATIFVNPSQFGPGEDFTAYPRTLDADLALLEAEGVDLVFTPSPAEIYPAGFQTEITVAHVSQGLEGERRPGHFQGVATVVAKLFNLTRADTAYFGQKDAQQVVVLRRMVADLNFPLDIAVIPTVRESDGLALSSRNRYLTPEQREAAAVIHRALTASGSAYDAGERDPDALRGILRSVVESEPLGALDYASIADPLTLREISAPALTPVLASLTVRFGTTRLLDNMIFPRTLNDRAGLTAVLGAV